MKITNRFGRRLLVLMMSILIAGAGILSAETNEPGPFQRFFRAMRRGVNEPQHKSTTHHSSHKQQTTETQTSPTPDPNAHATSGNTNNTPPNQRNTRSTTRASAKKGEDLP